MANRYWVGGPGSWSDNTNHWSTSSGGAAGASLPGTTDNAIFDTNSGLAGGDTIDIDVPIDILGFSSSSSSWDFDFSSGASLITRESFFWSASGGAFTGNGTIKQLNAPGSITAIQFHADGALDVDVYLDCDTGQTITVESNIETTGTITFGDDDASFGTIQFNSGIECIAEAYVIKGGVTIIPAASTTWICRPVTAAAYCFSASAASAAGGSQFSTNEPALLVELTTTNQVVFADANFISRWMDDYGTFNEVNIVGDGSTATSIKFIGTDIEFGQFQVGTAPVTVTWDAGTTYTFNSFETNAIDTQLFTYVSDSPGNPYFFVVNGSSLVSYIDVSDSDASGSAAPINDSLGGVDSGGNTNWLFGGASVGRMIIF